MASNDFEALSFSQQIVETLLELGFSQMTPIQSASIPLILEGKDLVGRSHTGSGKTAAFALPILQKIQEAEKMPQALVLCPTRELCEQVAKEFRKFSRKLKNIQIVTLVGGQPYPPQIQALHNGAHIVVGTPGRTLEMLKSDHLYVGNLKTLVLDEADRMLDEGFTEEVTRIISLLPSSRQTLFFSATYPAEVAELSQKFQSNPIPVTIDSEVQTAPSIEQFVYEAENPEKVSTLIRILQQHPSDSTLIFCRTKDSVKEISQLLNKFKVPHRPLHGDLEQGERDQAMALFRNGSLRILVATDIAARGLDIDHLELVVNFDLPTGPDVYLHRIGRTGRAGKSGVAVSMANAYEALKVSEIEKQTGQPMIRKKLGFENQLGLGRQFQSARMKTILISGGRKDKLRAGDILGALTASPRPLSGDQIGKIDVQDHSIYVAVSSPNAEEALQKLRNGKIKGAKFKCYFLET